MRFSIDQKMIDKILGYLVDRPYKEVFRLIAEIQKDAQPIVEQEVQK